MEKVKKTAGMERRDTLIHKSHHEEHEGHEDHEEKQGKWLVMVVAC